MTTKTSRDYKIQRSGLPEALANSLQERILRGEFKDGDQLVQEAIAREYDVSRMPVREALRQLEARGLATLHLHRGAIVTSIPAEQIAELFHLRVLLECDLLAAAMPRLRSSDFAAAKECLSKLEVAYSEGDISQWAPLNWDFHRKLYEPSGLVQTLNIVQSINIQTERYIRLQLSLTKSFAAAKGEHRELLRLCKSGDKDAAVAFLAQHVHDAGQRLLKFSSDAAAAGKSNPAGDYTKTR